MEVECRISKASSAFARLQQNVLERRGICLSTKLKVYQAVVISTLLYGEETWTIYAAEMSDSWAICMQRFSAGWRKSDSRITYPDSEILARASMPSIHSLLEQAQARWAGHVLRMNNQRIPKQTSKRQAPSGTSQAPLQRRFQSCFSEAWNSCYYLGRPFFGSTIMAQPYLRSRTLPQDRPSWRSFISRGVNSAEECRRATVEGKRAARKARAARSAILPCTVRPKVWNLPQMIPRTDWTHQPPTQTLIFLKKTMQNWSHGLHLYLMGERTGNNDKFRSLHLITTAVCIRKVNTWLSK